MHLFAIKFTFRQFSVSTDPKIYTFFIQKVLVCKNLLAGKCSLFLPLDSMLTNHKERSEVRQPIRGYESSAEGGLPSLLQVRGRQWQEFRARF